MRVIAASEMKNRLGAYFEAAQTEPLTVERSGRPSVVVVSVAEYERLKGLEQSTLEHGYIQMAADQAREAEATQWINALAVDMSNETR